MTIKAGPREETWLIELAGSEIARIEQDKDHLTVVLAAARVSDDRRKLDRCQSGGHLQGVRCHLFSATWSGEPGALIGRIDEAEWVCKPAHAPLIAPSSGTQAVRLSLRTAWGDALEVHALAWQIELLEGGRFTPSMAC